MKTYSSGLWQINCGRNHYITMGSKISWNCFLSSYKCVISGDSFQFVSSEKIVSLLGKQRILEFKGDFKMVLNPIVYNIAWIKGSPSVCSVTFHFLTDWHPATLSLLFLAPSTAEFPSFLPLFLLYTLTHKLWKVDETYPLFFIHFHYVILCT